MGTITIDNATPNKNIFKTNDGSTYRLSGFMYVYNQKDGERKFVHVNREDANAVYGTGVAGAIVEFGKFEFIDEVTTFTFEYITKRQKGEDRRILMDVDRFVFLKTVPLNLTVNQYEDFVIDSLLDDMFGKE